MSQPTTLEDALNQEAASQPHRGPSLAPGLPPDLLKLTNTDLDAILADQKKLSTAEGKSLVDFAQRRLQQGQTAFPQGLGAVTGLREDDVRYHKTTRGW